MPEDQTKQMRSMERMMDLRGMSPDRRPPIRAGNLLFLAAGWPSNLVDVEMALAAGKGLPPEPYESIANKLQYQERMRQAGFPVADSA